MGTGEGSMDKSDVLLVGSLPYDRPRRRSERPARPERVHPDGSRMASLVPGKSGWG